MSEPSPTACGEIDERFVGQWVQWGYVQLAVYLAHHAAFAEWCSVHDRK